MEAVVVEELVVEGVDGGHSGRGGSDKGSW